MLAYSLPLPGLMFRLPEQYNQWSQEFRVTSPADQTITYLAGAYFQTDHLFYVQDFSYDFLTPTLKSVLGFAPLWPYLPLAQHTSMSQMEDDYSVFGSVDWNITDEFKITGGVRGVWVYKNYNWDNNFGQATALYGAVAAYAPALQTLADSVGVGTAGNLAGDRADTAWLPSVRAQYRIAPDKMIYASYAGGFKSGGFNGASQSAMADDLPFAPEHVAAWEVGFKSKWLDNTLLFNIDAFHSQYNGLQVAVNINTNGDIRSLVQNAGSSVTQGVEMESEWAVTHNLHLRANVSYDDSHYITYPNVTPTQLQQVYGIASQDLSGSVTAFAPKWSGSLTGSYTETLPDDYQFTGEVTAYYTDSYYMDGSDDSTVRQTAFTRVDARLTLLWPDGRWALDVLGKNLTDRTVYSFSQAMPLSLGSVAVEREEPRNFAFQVRYQW